MKIHILSTIFDRSNKPEASYLHIVKMYNYEMKQYANSKTNTNCKLKPSKTNSNATYKKMSLRPQPTRY